MTSGSGALPNTGTSEEDLEREDRVLLCHLLRVDPALADLYTRDQLRFYARRHFAASQEKIEWDIVPESGIAFMFRGYFLHQPDEPQYFAGHFAQDPGFALYQHLAIQRRDLNEDGSDAYSELTSAIRPELDEEVRSVMNDIRRQMAEEALIHTESLPTDMLHALGLCVNNTEAEEQADGSASA